MARTNDNNSHARTGSPKSSNLKISKSHLPLLLAFLAGWADVVSFQTYKMYSSMMTGNFINLVTNLMSQKDSTAIQLLVATLVGFSCGYMLYSKIRANQPLAVIVFVLFALVDYISLLSIYGKWPVVILAGASGLINAFSTSSECGITNMMTGHLMIISNDLIAKSQINIVSRNVILSFCIGAGACLFIDSQIDSITFIAQYKFTIIGAMYAGAIVLAETKMNSSNFESISNDSAETNFDVRVEARTEEMNSVVVSNSNVNRNVRARTSSPTASSNSSKASPMSRVEKYKVRQEIQRINAKVKNNKPTKSKRSRTPDKKKTSSTASTASTATTATSNARRSTSATKRSQLAEDKATPKPSTSSKKTNNNNRNRSRSKPPKEIDSEEDSEMDASKIVNISKKIRSKTPDRKKVSSSTKSAKKTSTKKKATRSKTPPRKQTAFYEAVHKVPSSSNKSTKKIASSKKKKEKVTKKTTPSKSNIICAFCQGPHTASDCHTLDDGLICVFCQGPHTASDCPTLKDYEDPPPQAKVSASAKKKKVASAKKKQKKSKTPEKKKVVSTSAKKKIASVKKKTRSKTPEKKKKASKSSSKKSAKKTSTKKKTARSKTPQRKQTVFYEAVHK